jgi:hypothetical protein
MYMVHGNGCVFMVRRVDMSTRVREKMLDIGTIGTIEQS